jgi:hypothetical protein
MTWNLKNSVSHLTKSAKLAYSEPGECASYVRNALAAGGIELKVPRKRYPDASGASACDYGASLEEIGFKVVFDNSDQFMCQRIEFKPIAGDIAIFQPFDGHRHGHIQMFNGVRWVSDFLQKQIYPDQAPGLYPGSKYRALEIPFAVYRHSDVLFMLGGP